MFTRQGQRGCIFFSADPRASPRAAAQWEYMGVCRGLAPATYTIPFTKWIFSTRLWSFLDSLPQSPGETLAGVSSLVIAGVPGKAWPGV